MNLKRDGMTRWVLLIGKYALKFPRPTEWRLFLHGLLANLQEGVWWDAKFSGLCPIILRFPGGIMNVARRADPIPVELWESFDSRAWADRGDFVIPVEDKQCSFGIVDGEIVAVDYGGF